MFKHYVLSLVIALLSFIAVIFVFESIHTSYKDFEIKDFEILESNLPELAGKYFSGNFVYYTNTPITLTLKTKIPEENSRNIQYLFFKRFHFTYAEIYFDGKLSYVFGRRNHIYQTGIRPELVFVPEGTKDIFLKVEGINRVGFKYNPVLTNSYFKFVVLNSFTNILPRLIFGITATLIPIFLSLTSVLKKSHRRAYILLTFSMLASIFSILRLVPGLYSRYEHYLIHNCIFCLSEVLAIVLLILGLDSQFGKISLEKIFSRKINFYQVILILNISTIVLILTAFSKFGFVYIETFAKLLVIFNAVILLCTSLIIYSRTIFGISLFIILTNISSLLFNNFDYLSVLSGVPFILSASYILVRDFKYQVTNANQYRTKSLIDPLTGAYNRNVIYEGIFDEGDVLAFIDLDKLKKVNDTYGHKAGDKLLITLVETLRSNLRSTDYVIRYGGDEFLVILKSCNIKKGNEIMERALEKFKRSLEFPASFSFGIVEYNGSVEDTIKDADYLMYAKRYYERSVLEKDFELDGEGNDVY